MSSTRSKGEAGAIRRRVVEALAGMPTATPTESELAAASGLPAEELRRVLDLLERAGEVERWRDPGRPGAIRIMLGAQSARRLGLSLAPRGDRWIGPLDVQNAKGTT